MTPQNSAERMAYIERAYALRGLGFLREYYFMDPIYPKPVSDKES